MLPDPCVAVLSLLVAAGNPPEALAAATGVTLPDHLLAAAVGGEAWDWERHRRRQLLRSHLDNTVREPGPDGCWLWTGGRNRRGGAAITGRRALLGTTSVARQVYMLVRREFDLGIDEVLHVCGRGGDGCIRPTHLQRGPRRLNGFHRTLHRRGERPTGPAATDLADLDVLDVDIGRLRYLADLERLLCEVVPTRDGCLVVSGLEDCGHYAVRSVNGVRAGAHRLVMAALLGRDPVKPVMHSCDHKPCLAVGHLREGTPPENRQAAIARGLIPRGADHPRAALTAEQAAEVRTAPREVPSTELAVRHGVTPRVIRGVRQLETYVPAGTAPIPRRIRLSRLGVRSVRLSVRAGVQRDDAARRTGLGRRYIDEVAAGHARPDPDAVHGIPAQPEGGQPSPGERLAVAEIIQRSAAGESAAAIARDLGVSATWVQRRLRGRR